MRLGLFAYLCQMIRMVAFTFALLITSTTLDAFIKVDLLPIALKMELKMLQDVEDNRQYERGPDVLRVSTNTQTGC
ncbi:hypothetical protein V1504DRAFT_456734 [Lipomyces starkeyi]